MIYESLIAYGEVAANAGKRDLAQRCFRLLTVVVPQRATASQPTPGRSETTDGAKSFAALPVNAPRYLERIETLARVPIAMVSTGPDRAETILVHHPFQ